MAKTIQYEFIKEYKEGIHDIKVGEVKILSNSLRDVLLKDKTVRIYDKNKPFKKK